MSNEQKRMKPPPLKLGNFQAPEGAVPAPRPSFYSEESTMITSLSDLERHRIAKGDSAKVNVPPAVPGGGLPPSSVAPPLKQKPSLSSLSTPQVNSPEPEDADHYPFNVGGNKPPANLNDITDDHVPIPNLIADDAFEGTHQLSPHDLQALEEAHQPNNINLPIDQPSSGQVLPIEYNGQTAPAGMVVVFNSRGGVGASTLAVNLAGASQSLGQHVALIDLDLQLGAVSSMLDGKPLERSLAELVMEVSESTDGQLKSAIDERNGIHIIAQEGRISEIGMVTPDRLPRFFEAVRSQHNLVVIDGVRSFSDQAVTAMDAADVILVVVTQDIPALRSARQVLSLFKRLGYENHKVRLVVNRYQRKNPLTIEVIEERLDHTVYEILDNHFPFVSSLIEEGRLARDVNLKHKVTQGFDRLASRVLGFEVNHRSTGLRGFFSRFRRS